MEHRGTEHKEKKNINKSNVSSGMVGLEEQAGKQARAMLENIQRENKEELPEHLNFEDFCAIDFQFGPDQRFYIMNDIIEKLTGLKMQRAAKKDHLPEG